jgi:Protein of unknown function (DUF2637)
MNGGSDRWIRWTTTGCVALLVLIARTVSYLHRTTLVELHGQPGLVAALTPFSVDGMIVAASTTLLADSRAGPARRGAAVGEDRSMVRVGAQIGREEPDNLGSCQTSTAFRLLFSRRWTSSTRPA